MEMNYSEVVRAEHVPKCLSVSHRWMVHHEANSLIVTVSVHQLGRSFFSQCMCLSLSVYALSSTYIPGGGPLLTGFAVFTPAFPALPHRSWLFFRFVVRSHKEIERLGE